jgi:hypothetical protein
MGRQPVKGKKSRSPRTLDSAIGRATQAYAQVGAQALLLKEILEVDYKTSHTMFFAVQNTRSRHEMFQSLLETVCSKKIRPYWDSLARFLETLAKFRNAIAHWHPYIKIFANFDDQTQNRFVEALGHPVPGKSLELIEVQDFPAFLADCRYAQDELIVLTSFMTSKPTSLPEKYQQPITRRNLALLRQPPIAKAPQPQRPPSVPKLSAAQRRAKAKKESRQSAAKKT